MKITMLGTGNAMVTECYNTCFMIDNDSKGSFLVDGGGGNNILRQLQYAGYHCLDIGDIFVTHKHVDHLLGIIWVIRTICQHMMQASNAHTHINRGRPVNVYGHEEVIALLRDLLNKLLWKEQADRVDEYVRLIAVKDGETRDILGRKVTFFDIRSIKEKQFGFCIELENGEKLTCCGDEPYHPCIRAYAENSEWLMHEAFCLHSQADLFSPYEKHHATVRDACETAEMLGVKNLLLYHTEDKNLGDRKKLYAEEGSRYFHGNLYIPDDLEVITV